MYTLIVSRGYPSERYKMNGIFEFDQAKALVKTGHKVIFMVIDIRSFRRKRKWGYESFIKDGVQIEAINIPVGRLPNYFLSSIRILAFKKLYKKILNKYGKPDVIHAHFINYGYVIARSFSDKKNEVPLVLSEHFSGINKEVLDAHLMRLGKYTYPRMDKVIAVSQYLANGIKKKFKIDAEVIPNIVDTSSFVYKKSNKKNNEFNFISTGRLVTGKRMHLLVEAFYNAFSDRKNVNLYIYGEGPERTRLEKLIQQYGLVKQVHLKGLVERKEIAKKMSESDCFVLASKLETFGVAYIEALVMGLPVIATKCGGPEDFVHDENGLLIPVDNVESLTSALLYLYKNINRYNRKEISEEASRKFSPESIANELISLYKKVITSKSNKGRLEN